MKILGIDEAGRGCVIGPMVMCGYLVDSSDLPMLKNIGVKDSKMLSAKKRNQMLPKLEKIALDCSVLAVSAKEIDGLRTVSNLNKMEIERMQQLISASHADKVIIDALEANEGRFLEKVKKGLDTEADIIAENFADRNYVEVGAASILAKIRRDAEIERLHSIYGDFGSGYSSDLKTINFLKDVIKRNQGMPSFVRKSWFTVQWIREEMLQMKISL